MNAFKTSATLRTTVKYFYFAKTFKYFEIFIIQLNIMMKCFTEPLIFTIVSYDVKAFICKPYVLTNYIIFDSLFEIIKRNVFHILHLQLE